MMARLRMIARSVAAVMRTDGIRGVISAVLRRVSRPVSPAFIRIRPVIKKGRGIEIGGPSGVFSRTGLIPVYPLAGSLDNTNFGSNTVWEGSIREGQSFVFDETRPPGRQLIREATDLHGIESASYDFVLSSHMLEHTANPVRALREWLRILRPGGHGVIIVPDRERTFDHRRPPTPVEHMMDDYARNVGEDDLTCLDEVLAFHDIARDAGVASKTELETRARDNLVNRCLHHHVFDADNFRALLTASGFEVITMEKQQPFHVIAFVRRPG